MDERRKYFRLKNHGEINASLDNNPIEIVEISSNGAVVVKQKTDIPKKRECLNYKSITSLWNFAMK